MIIAVDFDGTLHLPDGSANTTLMRKLKASQRNGDTVILWTCRTGKSLTDALRFCSENGFIPNLVNQNAPQVIARMGDPRKIYADIYIDDKSMR